MFDQFNVGLRVLCGFGWAALDDCFQAVLRELDVHPGTGCYAVLQGMQKTLAHALLGKILKTSGLLRTLHLEVTAPPHTAGCIFLARHAHAGCEQAANKHLIRRFGSAVAREVGALVEAWSPSGELSFHLCADGESESPPLIRLRRERKQLKTNCSSRRRAFR